MTAATTRRRATALLAAGALLVACGEDAGETTTAGDTATDMSAEDGAGDDAAVDDPTTDERSSADAETDDGSTADTATDDGTTDDGSTAGATGEGATADQDGTEGADAAGADGELASLTATSPDGSTFTLGDFEGRPVLVETFATWCSNCRQQLGDTQQAAVEAGEDAVFLALSVESDLDPASLTGYAQDNGFTAVTFGVLDDESLLALRDRFGGAVLTPPSTPKFRVGPDGAVSQLTTGYESVDEILTSLDT